LRFRQLETLRLFPPVSHLSKRIDRDTSVAFEGKSHPLHPPLAIFINAVGLHQDRATWGSDAHDFRPSRWLAPDATLGGESQMIQPPKGTFIAWSTGPRVCPGQKMAQVEFVAVMSALLRRMRVEPALRDGRNPEQARTHLKELMEDSMIRLSLQMNRPEDFVMRWVGR
jgi:cytochrome P450